MATLKLKHLLLYLCTFILLLISQFPAGSLIALACWMQVAILLWNKKFNATTQKKFFVLFLTLIPICIFWGSVNTFANIYFNENNLIFGLLISFVSFILCFWVTLLAVFSYQFHQPDQGIGALYSACVQGIKTNKKTILLAALIVFLITFLPVYMTPDYKIVLALVMAHLWLRRWQLKQVFLDFDFFQSRKS